MNKYSISLVESLNDDRYFIDARNWYMVKYVSPVLERFYALSFAVILMSAALIEVMFVNTLYTTVINYPVEVIMDDTIDYQPIIKDVGAFEQEVDPYISVAKYLASNYVRTRESYSYNDLETQVQKIQNNSTKHIYKQFYNNISLDNPNSPVLLYQRSMTRDVKIKSVICSSDNNMIVEFEAVVNDRNHNEKEVTSWLAYVTFSMSDVNYLVQKQGKKFYFVVSGYRTQAIK